MRKMSLILVLIQTIFLIGCKTEIEPVLELETDTYINMENLDEYMFRDDVQYVDLRNFEGRFNSGFIYSFESIPFFDYLDYRAFDRGDTYEFSPSQIINSAELERLFDRNKSIFLYADGCIRAGYVKDALISLGYEKVFVLGGYFEYDGLYKVLGDGSYHFGDSFYSKYIDTVTGYTYIVSGSLDMGRKITEIRFDIIDSNLISLRSPNYFLDINYNDELIVLEQYIVSDIVTFSELYFSFNNLEQSGYDSIANFNLGISQGLIEVIEDFIPQ